MAEFAASVGQWFYDHAGGGVVIFLALIGAPFVLSRWVVGASWLQVAIAFAVFFCGLFLYLISGGGARAVEAFIFTLILGMFGAWLAVPLVALVLRLTGIPSRLL